MFSFIRSLAEARYVNKKVIDEILTSIEHFLLVNNIVQGYFGFPLWLVSAHCVCFGKLPPNGNAMILDGKLIQKPTLTNKIIKGPTKFVNYKPPFFLEINS